MVVAGDALQEGDEEDGDEEYEYSSIRMGLAS
jgi:hypothetical protein